MSQQYVDVGFKSNEEISYKSQVAQILLMIYRQKKTTQ